MKVLTMTIVWMIGVAANQAIWMQTSSFLNIYFYYLILSSALYTFGICLEYNANSASEGTR